MGEDQRDRTFSHTSPKEEDQRTRTCQHSSGSEGKMGED